MKILKRVRKLFSRKEDQSIKTSTSTDEFGVYDIMEVQKNIEWEKEFLEYTSFVLLQQEKKYHIYIHFKETEIDENKKEEISKFIKDGFQKNIDYMSIVASLAIIYEVGLGKRGIPEENKLLLFVTKG